MIGIIIQARQGSTRLPNKMNLPFFLEDTILDLVIKKLKENFSELPIILATTTNENDDSIFDKGNELGIKTFRGSEENVIERFVEAAKENNISKIIRICADNPFLDIPSLKNLVDEFQKNEYDYISYQTSTGIPSIKTHYGFWAEGVKTQCLEKVKNFTTMSFYREHVTNYIYDNTEEFDIRFLKIPDFIENTKIRLTIDSYEDFQVAKKIYQEANRLNISSIKELIHIIKTNHDWLGSMEEQINKNNK